MLERWHKALCRFGFHNFEVEYRSAPGVFCIDGKEVFIEGKVERCARCPALFFSYKDWPRMECFEQQVARPGGVLGLGNVGSSAPALSRPARRFAIA
jgi:hypothetical protein